MLTTVDWGGVLRALIVLIPAIAQGFATNGAKVFITGRRRELLDSVASESNGKIIAWVLVLSPPDGRIQGDVATKEGCVAAAAAISQRTNHVDVLVNNAGVLIPFRKKLRAHPNDRESGAWPNSSGCGPGAVGKYYRVSGCVSLTPARTFSRRMQVGRGRAADIQSMSVPCTL